MTGTKIVDIMTTDVEFIAPEASVQEAAELMGEIEVGALPVGTAEQLEGIVTDRDLLYRVVARGLTSSAVQVREVMSHPVVTCRAEDSLQSAMDMMTANHIRRLPVQDAAGRVTGWVTLTDLSRHLLVSSEGLQSALRSITEAAR